MVIYNILYTKILMLKNYYIKKNSKNKFKIKIFNKLNIFFSYVDILNHIIFKWLIENKIRKEQSKNPSMEE